MGKCLSCFKSQNVPGICMNESSNTHKNKIDKPSLSITIDQEQPQSVSSVMSGFIHTGKTNRTMSQSGSDGITSNTHLKSSPFPSKNRHFPPFFNNKTTNSDEKTSKRVFSLDVKLNNLFDKYKDSEDENLILMDGVEKLCSDLNLRPDDFKILIFAWKLNAEQMYQFTRQEFVNGCKELNAENIQQIQNKLSDLVSQLKNDPLQFRNLYKFTFKFGLDQASGQRILPIDMALCLWKVAFTYNKPPILDRWLMFLQSDKTHVRGVPRDTWNMFLNFCETVGNDLSTYNDAEAWPSIFDDFVEYENDRLNQNVVLTETANSFHEKRKVKAENITTKV